MTTAILDADYIRYAVACAGETRSILVTHKASGRTKEFPTRTEFWGNWRTKDGGYLADINKSRTSPFTYDEFDVEDVQRAEDLANVLHSCKLMYENVVKAVGATKHKGFLGKGKSFRHDLATVLEYKGNRKDLITPLLMQEVTEYMVKKFKVEIVEGIEADDKCVIEAFRKPDCVVIAVDKDTGGCAVNWYNPNKPEQGIINCNQFGKLWLDDKKEVKGYGRLFHYFQCGYGDDVDNYRANSACSVKWGKQSAYKALADVQDDKEALTALVGIYKKLYPEETTIKGWRGDSITIDAAYMLSENWHLSRMLRTYEELENKVEVLDVLSRMGIEV